MIAAVKLNRKLPLLLRQVAYVEEVSSAYSPKLGVKLVGVL